MTPEQAGQFRRAGERARLEADGPGRTWRIVRVADGATAGRLELEAEGESLTVRTLVIAPEYRGYGLGSEVARLVREAAEAGGWRLLRAWAPPHLGLAVYFWCRMGLRPRFGEGPEGGIWFERALARDSALPAAADEAV